MEMMGRKNGFYATDAEQEEMRKRVDSRCRAGTLMQLRAGRLSTRREYAMESKKIAGYDCKKALIIATRGNGRKDVNWLGIAPILTAGHTQHRRSFGGFGGFYQSSGQQWHG